METVTQAKIGMVVSDKMQKTVVVAVESTTQAPTV